MAVGASSLARPATHCTATCDALILALVLSASASVLTFTWLTKGSSLRVSVDVNFKMSFKLTKTKERLIMIYFVVERPDSKIVSQIRHLSLDRFQWTSTPTTWLRN